MKTEYYKEIANFDLITNDINTKEKIEVVIKMNQMQAVIKLLGFGKKTMVQFSLMILSLFQEENMLTDEEVTGLIKQYYIPSTSREQQG